MTEQDQANINRISELLAELKQRYYAPIKMESKTAIQLTPMQQLIAELTAASENKINYLRNDLPQRIEHMTHGELFSITAAIHLAKTYLPKEQEAIEQAYSFGSLNKTENILNGKTKITAEEYYQETYKS